MLYAQAFSRILTLKQRLQLKNFHIDSRLIQAGDCFVALPGKQVDGCLYIQSALAQGAKLVLSHQPFDHPDVVYLPNLADDLISLAKDIQKYRRYQTIALTGSVGKTTTRHMLYQVLSANFRVTMAYGNYNNEMGVPLTILSANLNDDFLILEMGAAKPGDIKYLMNIATVDLSFCLPVLPVHLANYNNFEQLVDTKSDIYRILSKQALAVIDLDQPQAGLWQSLTMARVVAIGSGGEIELHVNDALYIVRQGQVVMSIDNQHLPSHLYLNIKMVAGVMHALGIGFDGLKLLEKYQGLPGRLYHYSLKEITLFDDSYNASVTSVKAAIDLLARQPKRKILVFGSMGELGESSAWYHQEIGEYANGRVDELIAVGHDAFFAHEAFCGVKKHISETALFQDDWIKAGSAVVVKGSRFMKMERIVQLLLSKFSGEYVS